MQAEQLKGRDSKEMFEIITEITGKKRAYRGEIIKDTNGNLLTEGEEVQGGGNSLSRSYSMTTEVRFLRW